MSARSLNSTLHTSKHKVFQYSRMLRPLRGLKVMRIKGGKDVG